MSIELVSPAPQTDFGRGPHWLHESPFLPVDWDWNPTSGAVASLKQMAMKRVLADQSALKVVHFRSIPWPIAKWMWESLRQPEKQTMHLWLIMASVYPSQFFSLSPSYCLKVGYPKEPLIDYINMMISENVQWRAILSISTEFADVTDLVSIGNIKNLVALEVNRKQSSDRPPGKSTNEHNLRFGAEDRIFRSWAEMSLSGQSLQYLRVLKLCNQVRLGLSILHWLAKLPQLKVIVTCSCQNLTEKLKETVRGQSLKESVPIEGWIAHTPRWVTDKDKGHTGWYSHGNIRRLYMNSLVTGVVDRGEVYSNNPILEFELPQLHRAGSDLDALSHGLYEEMTAGSRLDDTIIFTRPSSPQESSKKRQSDSPFRPHNERVLKKRSRDMTDMLSEFM